MPISFVRRAFLGGACAAAALLVAGCSHLSNEVKTSDVAGVYEALLPCADCPGIRMSLYVRAAGSYTRVMRYEGYTNTFTDGGNWEMKEDGAITFYPAADNEDPWYAVAIPGGIRFLDRMGKPIEGRLAKFYDLKKN